MTGLSVGFWRLKKRGLGYRVCSGLCVGWEGAEVVGPGVGTGVGSGTGARVGAGVMMEGDEVGATVASGLCVGCNVGKWEGI